MCVLAGAAGHQCEHEGRRMRQLASIVWLHCLVGGKRKKKILISVFFLGGTGGNRDSGEMACVPLRGL